MTGHQRHSLKLVTTPIVGRAISAPPILNASDHTVDFECGKCGMYGEHGQVLKRGHELAGVLAPVERRLMKVVSG